MHTPGPWHWDSDPVKNDPMGRVRYRAHHDDYSRPLDVRWLCQPHHLEHHMKSKAEGK